MLLLTVAGVIAPGRSIARAVEPSVTTTTYVYNADGALTRIGR
jgi:YD repeat-containing protein